MFMGRPDWARFSFDVSEGGGFVRDEIGAEFPDELTAIGEALSLLPNLARDLSPPNRIRKLRAMVRDETGRPIHRALLTIRGERVEP